MIATSDFEKGMVIKVNGEAWQIADFQFYKPGKGGAVMRTWLKNFNSGKVLQKTFRSGERFEELEVEYEDASYLYSDRRSAVFQLTDKGERLSFDLHQAQDWLPFLKEGGEVSVVFLDGKPVSVNVPTKMELKVTEAPPAVKGNTVSGALKTVTLETGLKINVPVFVKEGDVIIINTESKEYVSRAK